jgi:hypothetical protein
VAGGVLQSSENLRGGIDSQPRTGKDPPAKGDIEASDNLKSATITFGGTIYVRTQGRLAPPNRFATVYDSTTADNDTIDVVN